ncbi:MAG: NAD-dependent epimerase/dehydratase family protein [Candidatus Paceibacterota bacterium]|jgi:UDP-glucose 4-epimerase|nr:NAD-dependent epimerase/dehydratase family protein [Candidatus Paceibacterota bacterium]
MNTEQKTILVTGGAGFIGSHLIERLVADPNNRVISLDNYFTGKEENHIQGAEYRRGHTKDIEKLIPETPDTLYHLGEYSRVEKSFDDVSKVLDMNVVGTFSVLEFCRKNKSKIIYAGSSTKFADGGMGRDQSPYAWSKATNTELVRNYGEWFGVDYAISYFYNVYGGREISSGDYATLMGIFKERYLSGKVLSIVSPGTQQRNFTHIDDIVNGLQMVGEKGHGDEYGLGATESYSILDIAKMFGSTIEMLPERPGNRMGSKLDIHRATQELGWNAERKLTDYVEEIKRSKK